MIAHAEGAPLLLRLAAPIAWRNDATIAKKLLGFAATEEGSALDMLRASERCKDPRCRRLFFRHAVDEARHARRFREAARAVAPDARIRTWEAAHARRQDLYERFGLVPFVAFVHASESRAKKQFDVLARHFADHDVLGRLFTEIGRDERFHATYSAHLLDRWREEGRGDEVDRAVRRVKRHLLWSGWRRAGKRLMDPVGRLVLALLFVTIFPLFVLLGRLGARARAGWHAPDVTVSGLGDLRRPY